MAFIANILCTKQTILYAFTTITSLDGYVKLIDFGMCKTHLTDEKTATFCGTLEYMAPEIYANFSYSYAIDYWSFGILIFEMIYSMRPFQRNR